MDSGKYRCGVLAKSFKNKKRKRRKLELELEGASNFRVVNIFGGVRVRDCKYFSMENENQLESIGNYHR